MGASVSNAGENKWTYIDKLSYAKNVINLPTNWKELGILIFTGTSVSVPLFILPREVFTQDSVTTYEPSMKNNNIKLTIAADKITRDSGSTTGLSASVYYR